MQHFPAENPSTSKQEDAFHWRLWYPRSESHTHQTGCFDASHPHPTPRPPSCPGSANISWKEGSRSLSNRGLQGLSNGRTPTRSQEVPKTRTTSAAAQLDAQSVMQIHKAEGKSGGQGHLVLVCTTDLSPAKCRYTPPRAWERHMCSCPTATKSTERHVLMSRSHPEPRQTHMFTSHSHPA